MSAPAWDTTDELNPQPLIYPVCIECGEAYGYRRALSLTRGGYVWAWFRPPGARGGCKHKAGMVKNTEWREP